MSNYKFRLSDMMPNAWFYKLKDMARTKKHNFTSTTTTTKNKKQQHSSPASSSSPNYTCPTKLSKQPHHHNHNSPYPRKSYYFTRGLTPSSDDPKLFTTSFQIPVPPRKSSKERSRRTTRHLHKVVSSAVSAGCSCRATNLWSNNNINTGDCLPDYSAASSDTSPDPEDSFPPEFRSHRALTSESFDDILSWSQSTSSRNSNYNNEILIDVDKKSLTTRLHKEIPVLDKVLPPIITKPKKVDENLDEKTTKKKETKQPTKPNKTSTQQRSPGVGSIKRHSANSPGVRLRVNSPRIGNRRVLGRKSLSRKSLSESLAIVKASSDPRRDFRVSMVEMIVENNIRASKDLEDLLACYLSLNSDEYHDLIINVFKQIWFDLTNPDKLQ